MGQRVLTTLHGLGAGPDQFTEWIVPLEAGRCYWFGYAACPWRQALLVLHLGPREPPRRHRGPEPGRGRLVIADRPTGCTGSRARWQAEPATSPSSLHAKQGAVPAPPLNLVATIEARATAAAPGAARIGISYSGSAGASGLGHGDGNEQVLLDGPASRARSRSSICTSGTPRNSRLAGEPRRSSRTSIVGSCAREPGEVQVSGKGLQRQQEVQGHPCVYVQVAAPTPRGRFLTTTGTFTGDGVSSTVADRDRDGMDIVNSRGDRAARSPGILETCRRREGADALRDRRAQDRACRRPAPLRGPSRSYDRRRARRSSRRRSGGRLLATRRCRRGGLDALKCRLLHPEL